MALPKTLAKEVASRLKRRVTRGASNYPYVCARIRAKKSYLLTKDVYPRLLAMSVTEIARFIGETQYNKEITELGLCYKGVDLIEHALNLNLSRTFHDIIGYCTGELRTMVQSYLRSFDVWNIKTIMRGKFAHATQDEILSNLIFAGSISRTVYTSMLSVHTFDEMFELLRGTEYYDKLMTLRRESETITDIGPYENMLDIIYYDTLVSSITPDDKPKQMFLEFIRREIDIINLKTLLKVKLLGIQEEERAEQKLERIFIKNGLYLKFDDFKNLIQSKDIDAFKNELSKIRLYEAISGVAPELKVENLSMILREIEKYHIKLAERFSLLYPLSILPIINYIIRKKVEVLNLHIIARGKEAGLDTELLKKLIIV